MRDSSCPKEAVSDCQAFLQGALRAASIVPSNDEVSTSDFLAALTQQFGYEPILFCDEDRSGNTYIDSVRCTAVLQRPATLVHPLIGLALDHAV